MSGSEPPSVGEVYRGCCRGKHVQPLSLPAGSGVPPVAFAAPVLRVGRDAEAPINALQLYPPRRVWLPPLGASPPNNLTSLRRGKGHGVSLSHLRRC